eukprot:CAMPEP_0196754268 /NCGR_PEP_ID=MMETSP1091-20130531/93457_1 /TAXON_ID=302021 /ORGANISM="Rhodomonas sp., Strain CCMP768" /LENGTH=50 /DNA_ID=CAMNT_0042102501 /DNA_START=132 /DNA_END=282 /DNA_ORIENTATION=+
MKKAAEGRDEGGGVGRGLARLIVSLGQSSDSACELDVFDHDGDAAGVDGA